MPRTYAECDKSPKGRNDKEKISFLSFYPCASVVPKKLVLPLTELVSREVAHAISQASSIMLRWRSQLLPSSKFAAGKRAGLRYGQGSLGEASAYERW